MGVKQLAAGVGSPMQRILSSGSSSPLGTQFLKMFSSTVSPKLDRNNNIGVGRTPLGFRSTRSTPPLGVSFQRNISTLLRNPLHQTQAAVKAGEEPDLSPVTEPNYGERLYLTPYIEGGLIEEAQRLSRVNLTTQVESYSGFLTVNPVTESNLFFWFFPAAFNAEDAPVLLWLNGGPGASSLFGLFAGHSPILIDSNYELQLRKTPWTLTHSIIYIDSPVGTGFSFTNDESGYAKTLDDVVRDLYEGLQQFFKLFPQFQPKDFYVAGQSYTGKYGPAISHKIHRENQSLARESQINLKGLAIGSGLCDPLTQTDYGEYLYNIGLIDDTEKKSFDATYSKVCDLILKEDWAEAHKALQYLMIGWPRPIVSQFETVTGFTFNSNYLHEDMPERYAYYIKYLENPSVRQSIHVGDQGFGTNRNKVYELLSNDFAQSVKPLIEELLNENYKILFYASQLDVVVPHTGIDRFIRSLSWKHSQNFLNQSRQVWKVNSEIAGYSKEYNNLVHLLIRNAGHVAPFDQPERCFDMITRFTRGHPF